MSQIWDILQIEATTDKREIKKAYARQTTEIHPEEKPEEFQMLYEAYQKALQYASLGRGEKEKRVSFDMPQTEAEKEPKSKETTEEQDKYQRLGFDSKAARKEQFRLEEIGYFQNGWKKQIIAWANNAMFLNEEWKQYLLSDKFREIMWSPIVLETIVRGVRRYCMQKEEILLFFWDLYDFENLRGRSFEGVDLQLYKILFPAYTNRVKRQQYEKNRTGIMREENRHIWKPIMIIACIVVGGIISGIFLLTYYKVLELKMVLAACFLVGLAGMIMLVVWLIWYTIRG